MLLLKLIYGKYNYKQLNSILYLESICAHKNLYKNLNLYQKTHQFTLHHEDHHLNPRSSCWIHPC